MLLLGQWKHLKYGTNFQKILKFLLLDELWYGQLNGISKNQTAFYIKYYFNRRKSKVCYQLFFLKFLKNKEILIYMIAIIY